MVISLMSDYISPDDLVVDMPPERFVMLNLKHTIAHVKRHWQVSGNPMVGFQDLLSQASELLFIAATQYPAWARKNGLDPYSQPIFWSFARKAIDWGLGTYLREKPQKTDTSLNMLNGEDDDDDFASGDLIRTQMSRHRPPSMLHRDIATYAAGLRRDWRIAIALRYFEELPYPEVAPLLGKTLESAQKLVPYVCKYVREYALSLVVEHPYVAKPPRKATVDQDTPELTAYIQNAYGCDVSTWLDWVAACYRADVAYVTDLLNQGSVIRRFGTWESPTRKLSDDNIRDIRTRRQSGDSNADVAAVYAVHVTTIEDIVANRTWRNVS
jgi:hypothetical protein